MAEHARLSPSKMERIITCPGSLALEERAERRVSIYSAEGTAAHTLASWALEDGQFNTRLYLGKQIEVIENKGKTNEAIMVFTVTEDMADHVQKYVDAVDNREVEFGLIGELADYKLMVEQRVDISGAIGVPGQFGTADAVILATYSDGKTILSVEDLKYGMGVAVTAENNKQLMTYAAGLYDLYSAIYDINVINIVIHMPRLGYVSEWSISPQDLMTWSYKELQPAAQSALAQCDILAETADVQKLTLVPDDKACRFCNAKAFCPAAATHAFREITNNGSVSSVDDFDALIKTDTVEEVQTAIAMLDKGGVAPVLLAKFLRAADMIDVWIKAVRARAEAELFAGVDVPGFKLVQGRRGNRAWVDEDAVAVALKKLRLSRTEMYTQKLISPAQAEKLLGDSPRRWSKVKELYSQPDGKPSVAPESDKRPALVIEPIIDSFQAVDDVA